MGKKTRHHHRDAQISASQKKRPEGDPLSGATSRALHEIEETSRKRRKPPFKNQPPKKRQHARRHQRPTARW